MSAQKKTVSGVPAGKGEAANALGERAIAILKQFNNPQIPFNVGQIRTLLFKSLYDACMYRNHTILDEEDFDTAFMLWKLTNEIENLNVHDNG